MRVFIAVKTKGMTSSTASTKGVTSSTASTKVSVTEAKTTKKTITTITRKTITKNYVVRTFKHQLKTGAFQINDELAVSIGFSSEKQLRTELTAYIKKHGKSDTSRLDTTTWVTILLLHYYRLVAIDHQTEWQAQYEISYRWLWSQFKCKESVEKEAFALIRSFVTEYYEVDEQTHKEDVQFVGKFEEKRKAIRETLVISSGKSTAGKL